MSTNCSFCGISIKLKENIPKKELLNVYQTINKKRYNGKFSEFKEKVYEKFKSNRWSLYVDIKGKLGLIYLIQDEYDVFDLDFSIKFSELEKILSYLDIEEDLIENESLKIFSYLYYNGSDNPFEF